MIVNVLRFSFKDGTSEERKAAVLARMRRTASVESVLFGTVGRDIGDPADGYTHAYVAGVADLVALERYLHDPVHIEGDFEILPYLAKLSPVRFTDDADPGLGEKVVALHLAKVAQYPEWGKLVESLSGGQIPADA
ncbi:Dabb family protein [Amycolatopsis acidicola]|uniref:Dabb family protein n=1 Tax=Amycolatopsis acidicola TaxID=2596893 RepID=A0A5N0V4R8_9PSEU|nr:Dabb family protein [Amycolatopsis acidicola]KAA9160120.1 Dabb family protein [Amycolatopsis acidicola]